MGNTRNTGYLQNIVQYDASNNITLPANLTVTGSITGYATTSYVGTQLAGYVPTTRTISINGTSYDLSANRSWSITSMIYPAAGIAVSTGTAWGTSLTDNSSNWNTAYGWGNHAGLYSLLNHTHTFASLTSKPTTLVGYGITDAATSAQGTSADTAYGWGNHAIAGYLTGITSGQVTTALGFTPYNVTNPTGYITSAALSTYATQSYVGTQIANLVASSPAALDTLNELAAALGNDAAFSTTVSTALGNRLRVDINTQGLSATQQGYGRTNLGLGTAATANTGDFVAYRTFGTAANSAIGDFVAYRTFGTAANNNTGDFALASHTHSIANITGLQTALDGKQASGSYAAATHSHIISDVTGLQTALDGKQASLGFTPYNSTNPSGYITSSALSSYLPLTGGTLSGTLSLNSYSFSGDFGAGKSIYFAVGYTSTRGINFGWDTTNDRGFIGSVYNGQAWKSLDLQPIGGSVLINGNTAWHSGNLTNNNQLTNGAGYITSYTETSTLANVTARGASTSTRTTFVEVGVTKDGSDTVATGPWFRWTNTAESRQMLAQLNASNGLTYWSYNGTAWVSAMTLSQTGVLSTTGALSVGNSTEVLGLIQMGSGGRYGMGVSGAYTNVYSHDSGLGVRLGSYNGTTFTPVLTVANTGAVTATGNITGANLSGTNTGDQTTISGNAGSATLLKSINTTSSILSNWNPQALTYQAWGQAWGHSSISADTGDIALWLRAGQYSAGGTEVCMIIDGDYYAASGAQKVLHAGNYGSYSLPLSGGTMTGQIIWSSGVAAISFQQGGNSGTYTQTTIYANQNNTSGDDGNGIFIERGYTNTSNTEIRKFIIGVRGGGVQWRLDGPGNVTQTGGLTATYLTTSGEGNFGPDSGSDNGIRIRYGNYVSGYGRIRFMQDGTNHSTIHSFSATWQSGTAYTASSGCINIDGQNGVTFGGWNTINAAITSEGLAIKPYTTPSGAKAWNSAGRIRVQQSDGTDVFIEMRNRADSGDYAGILFTDNNIGGYIGFRTYAANNLAAGSDCMIYGTYNDHIFQNGSSETFNGKTETFRIYANGSVRATGDITAYSDRRVKENIITIDRALEKTLQLRGVFYNRTDKDDKSQKVGVIAQEIQEILPQVVNEDYNGLLSVSYGNITGLLIEAVKEQQTQIESQKSEIDELKDLVKQLINRQ